MIGLTDLFVIKYLLAKYSSDFKDQDQISRVKHWIDDFILNYKLARDNDRN